MRRVAVHLPPRVSIATVLIASLVATVPIVPASAHAHAPAVDGDFDSLLARAEERRTAGAVTESARLYAAAYRALPPAERADLMGEITANNALADFRVAREQAPEDETLLTDHAALLEEVVADREDAHAAGKAEAAPSEMLLELGELRATLEQREREAEAEAAAAREEQDTEPEPVEPPEADPEIDPSETNLAPGIALLSVGLASIVGGGVSLGLGASNLGQLDRIVSDQEAALAATPEYTDEQRQLYLAGLQDWRQQGRTLSLGLMIGGGALAAVGIGLTTWGAVRLSRARKARSDMARLRTLRLSAHPRGASLSFEF